MRRWAAATLAIGAAASVWGGEGIRNTGCENAALHRIADARPTGPGPLRLVAVHCVEVDSPYTVTTVPSPDGRRYFSDDAINGLAIGAYDRPGRPPRVNGRVTQFLAGVSAPPPYGWSSDGRSVFGATQQIAEHGGWAVTPLSLRLFTTEGASRALPVLRTTGRLDAVRWVGGAGRAIVGLDTGGYYYRPERPNTRPTLAIVDARRGVVLDQVAVADLPGLDMSGRGPTGLRRRPSLTRLDARLDARGRVRALLAFGRDDWFWWREGERPRRVTPGPVPFGGDVLLTADDHTALVFHDLSASGPICEFNPRCPAPTPVTGPIAELRELASGRVIWSLTGTAPVLSGNGAPAISPDGRWALISMPGGPRGQREIALVSMRDSRIVQRIGGSWSGGSPIGFAADGRSAWVSGRTVVAWYRLSG